MRTIKKSILYFGIISLSLVSCKKDSGTSEMSITFNSTSGYTSTNSTLAGGTTIKVGVHSETNQKKDPLIKINMTEVINNTTTGASISDNINDQTSFDKDYSITLDTVSGNVHEYTFSVTNKDGLQAQKSLKITIQ